jgi:peptidoglycan/xylan/chitin deacetylase (PgdA/CDA1 family)
LLETVAGGAAIAGVLSARWNWWRPRAKGLPALMYHKVGEPPPGSRLAKLWVSAADFRRQMDYLKRHGCTAMLLSELRDAELGRRAMPARPVLITFDDGYANNYEVAFPILREFGMKGNIFLVCEAVGRHNSWHDPASEPWVRMLSWADIAEMQRSGAVEFGSHTMRHADLSRTPPDQARWELCESKKRLEDKLGRELLGFAYPYGAGAFAPEVRRLVRAAGYRYDFSIKQGISPWPWDPESGPLKRLLIRGDDYMLDFHLNLTRGKARF